METFGCGRDGGGPRTASRHLIWDWNGTLFDDRTLIVDAANYSFATVDGPRIDLEGFRHAFRRPIRDMYAATLGRPVGVAEFVELDNVFHDRYLARLPDANLAPDAVEALQMWPGTQSLLSMFFHRQLVPLVSELGLSDQFSRVDGLRRSVGGGRKAKHLLRHIEALGLAPADCAMIGDSLDDADAAVATGVRCVLYAHGMVDAGRLRATGFPVADSLTEAVVLASAANGVNTPAGDLGPIRSLRIHRVAPAVSG